MRSKRTPAGSNQSRASSCESTSTRASLNKSWICRKKEKLCCWKQFCFSFSKFEKETSIYLFFEKKKGLQGDNEHKPKQEKLFCRDYFGNRRKIFFFTVDKSVVIPASPTVSSPIYSTKSENSPTSEVPFLIHPPSR